MQKRRVRIKNERGIHLRPTSLIVKAAEKYESEILIVHNGKQGSAKEGLDIIILSLYYGEEAEVIANGSDEVQAADEIAALLETEFDFPEGKWG